MNGLLRPFLLEQMPEWHECSTTLSNSDCEALTLRELLSLATDEEKTAWEAMSLGYPSHNMGAPELLQAIGDLYQQAPIEAQEDVTVVVPQEGILLSISATLQSCPRPAARALR